jgi:DNA-directed RNA polymerase specialized sigma subunit
MARKSLDFKLTPEQQKMAADNINLARREAWRIQRTTGIDYSTLEGAAFLGLCKACYRYDPDSGYKFSSLATPTIRGELLHWVRDRTYAMRLSHKMRENWIKGRKMLYSGSSDIEVADELGLSLQEWQETRSACSGPPLELKDQSMPTDPLEAEEINFREIYQEKAAEIIENLNEEDKEFLDDYFNSQGIKPPVRKFQTLWEELSKRKLT